MKKKSVTSKKTLQAKLDKQKWLDSEKYSCDMSGKMGYCINCEYKTHEDTCYASQEDRERKFLCAKALENDKN